MKSLYNIGVLFTIFFMAITPVPRTTPSLWSAPTPMAVTTPAQPSTPAPATANSPAPARASTPPQTTTASSSTSGKTLAQIQAEAADDRIKKALSAPGLKRADPRFEEGSVDFYKSQ